MSKQKLVFKDPKKREETLELSKQLVQQEREAQGEGNRQLLVDTYERDDRPRRRRLSGQEREIIDVLGSLSQCPFKIRGFRAELPPPSSDWDPWTMKYVSCSRIRKQVNKSSSSFSRSLHGLLKKGVVQGLAMKWVLISHTRDGHRFEDEHGWVGGERLISSPKVFCVALTLDGWNVYFRQRIHQNFVKPHWH